MSLCLCNVANLLNERGTNELRLDVGDSLVQNVAKYLGLQVRQKEMTALVIKTVRGAFRQ